MCPGEGLLPVYSVFLHSLELRSLSSMTQHSRQIPHGGPGRSDTRLSQQRSRGHSRAAKPGSGTQHNCAHTASLSPLLTFALYSPGGPAYLLESRTQGTSLAVNQVTELVYAEGLNRSANTSLPGDYPGTSCTRVWMAYREGKPWASRGKKKVKKLGTNRGFKVSLTTED